MHDVLMTFMESFPRTAHAAPEQMCMAWMATTLKNAFISSLRKERVRQNMDANLADEQAVGSDPAIPDELPLSQRITDARLSEAIDSLSPKLREAFIASTQSKSYAQIGQELGIKEGAVAKRVHDARKRLKRSLRSKP